MVDIYFLLGLMFLFQVVTMAACTWLFTELKAMQKATHTIQYINPLDNTDFQKVTEDLKDKFAKGNKGDFDNIM